MNVKPCQTDDCKQLISYWLKQRCCLRPVQVILSRFGHDFHRADTNKHLWTCRAIWSI